MQQGSLLCGMHATEHVLCHSLALCPPIRVRSSTAQMLGLLTSRQDGGLAPAFLALAAFLAAAGTGLLLFPAPGRLAAASLELKGGYAADGSELDGLAAGEQSDKGGFENGEAAEQRRLWQGRQQQHSQHEVECQPILPGGSSNHS